MSHVRTFASVLFGAVALAAVSGGCATGKVVETFPDMDAGTTPTPDAACTKCGADCVDLKTDAKNCGTCGKACSSGAKCVQGTCQCNAGATTCGADCVDLKTDAKNCGTCGTVCGGGDGGAVPGGGTYGCTNGTCGIVCPMGKTECSAACVDTQADTANCGMCGKACMMGETCSKGVCCKAGETNCGGACVNPMSDPKNCGACGMACPMQTPACVGGLCKASSCGNATLDMGERCDGNVGLPGGGQITCRAPGTQNECKFDFSGVTQLYCNGTCSWAGGLGCDQADADLFCKLKTGKSTSVATSFTTGTATTQPGFPCPSGGFGTNLGAMPEYGVMANVWYQTTSLQANHGSGTVIASVVCN